MNSLGLMVITGGGSGIGRAAALRFANAGWQVLISGRSLEKLQATQNMALVPERIVPVAGDLCQAKVISDIAKKTQGLQNSAQQKLKVLVNNAGVFDRLDFIDTTEAIWQRHFQNNLMTAVNLTRQLLPQLEASAPSAIVNVSSTLGLRPVVATSAYSAMKAAMVNWTHTLALELASKQITVNCVCPGIVETPIHHTNGQPPNAEQWRRAQKMQPLGRTGKPEDVAESIWYLAHANWSTGSVVTIDGGISL